MYVTHINPYSNTITIGEKNDLVSSTLIAKELNLIKYDRIREGGLDIIGAIRYNDEGAHGTIEQVGKDEIKVHFPAGREAITPGQAVVCYEGNDVVAGGWIKKVNVGFEDFVSS